MHWSCHAGYKQKRVCFCMLMKLTIKSVVEEGPNKFWSTNCGKLLLNNEKFTPDLFRFGIHCDHFAGPMVNLPNCLPQNNDTVASLVARYARQQQKLMMTIHSVKSLFQNLELPILHLELYMLKWEEAGKEAFLKSHWIIALMLSVYVLKAPNAKKHQIQGTDVASTIILDIIPISMHFK